VVTKVNAKMSIKKKREEIESGTLTHLFDSKDIHMSLLGCRDPSMAILW
jgi:hypothetical protein